jgi:phosphoglycolate phosphatase
MLTTLIFDFDGVLGNTYQINFSVSKFFDPKISEQDFKDHHNGNVFEKPIIQFKDSDFPTFFKKQRRMFTEKELFPVTRMLQKLSKGYTLFIISSTSDENIIHFLKLKNLDTYFEAIHGATTHLSKTHKFKMIFENYNLDASQCMFITDTIGDIKEAQKVGVKSIAVTWGYHDEELLAKEKPYKIAHTPAELVQIIESTK